MSDYQLNDEDITKLTCAVKDRYVFFYNKTFVTIKSSKYYVLSKHDLIPIVFIDDFDQDNLDKYNQLVIKLKNEGYIEQSLNDIINRYIDTFYELLNSHVNNNNLESFNELIMHYMILKIIDVNRIKETITNNSNFVKEWDKCIKLKG